MRIALDGHFTALGYRHDDPSKMRQVGVILLRQMLDWKVIFVATQHSYNYNYKKTKLNSMV
jgi:hypothetical protein